MRVIPSLRQVVIGAAVGCVAAAPSFGQKGELSGRDSALVGRILLAENRRDTSSGAFREGSRHADARIRQLARRGAARIRDAQFVGRDSFPVEPTRVRYDEPGWRLRYRGLAAPRTDCSTLRGALADSAWPVRLRAADLAGAECARDSALVSTLRRWATLLPPNGARRRGEASWHAAAHALVALARIAPDSARALIGAAAASPIPWLRTYAARAAAAIADGATLRRLARDANANVMEAAIEALGRVAGHADDDVYAAALSSRGYQAVRAGARALAGSQRGRAMVVPLLAAGRRLRADSSETSRDARLAVLERIGELATPADAAAVANLATDFDCEVATAAAAIATRLGTATTPRCRPLAVALPADAVALSLGREMRLRVTLADSSGGGTFTVRLRGDVAPVMAARVVALARGRYYDGLTWHRVEPDFVIQGGGPGANEYVGYPRFFRDELGTLPHVRGTIGMSTRGHDTGDAQWFVNLRDNLRLNHDYTVFGEVVQGIEVVDGILEGDVIERIDVLENGST